MGHSSNSIRTPSTCGHISVAFVDADMMSRELFTEVLSKNSHFVLSGSVASAEEAFRLLEKTKVDVILVSNVPGSAQAVFDFVRAVRTRFPAVRCVVLLENSDQQQILAAFRSGTHGILRRDASGLRHLFKCLSSVCQGQIWASSEELSLLVQAFFQDSPIRIRNANGQELLSAREQQVVRLLADGMNNREIAQELQVSEHTVKNHLFRIYDKLGVSNRIEAVMMATRKIS